MFKKISRTYNINIAFEINSINIALKIIINLIDRLLLHDIRRIYVSVLEL